MNSLAKVISDLGGESDGEFGCFRVTGIFSG
jgi:hypothetical protein